VKFFNNNHIKKCYIDKNLSIDNHVNAVSKSVHYYICLLQHICSFLSEHVANLVVCALIGFRLDYANSVLYGSTS